MLLGYVVLFIAAVLALTVAVVIVKYYQCPSSAQAFTTVIASACIAFLLMCVLVVPVDVYNSSSGADSAATHQAVLRNLYFGIYVAVISMLFLVLPFAYFFHDEEGEHATCGARACAAAKASVCVLLVAAALVATGVWAYHRLQGSSGTSELDWVKGLFQNQSIFSFTIYYCIGVISTIGCVLWAVYAAYGMAALPLSMMRGFHSGEGADEEQQTLLAQDRGIQSRAARAGERLSRRDMRALQRLRRDAEAAAAAEVSEPSPVADTILSRLLLVAEPFYRLLNLLLALLPASWITPAADS
jgi:LMBR1 domain-containing protein 1